MKTKLESEEFYNLMLSYRNAPINNQFNVIEKYNNVKNYILQLSYPTKVDALIEKYENILQTLEENKSLNESGDFYPYNLDIRNTMKFIKHLKDLKL